MPRIARLVAEDTVFHILTRGNNRRAVFHEDKDYRHYLYLLKLYKEEHYFLLHHYCLMPNHIHLILMTTEHTDLAKLMKQVNLAYMHYYKRNYSHYGHFWQGRYKSLIIQKDEYLLTCGKYIELNPVKANIVKDPKDYPYSSYNFYASGDHNTLIDTNPLYADMGKTNKQRQLYYTNLVVDNLKIEQHQRFIGSKDFIKTMEERFGVKSQQRKRGRPVKGIK